MSDCLREIDWLLKAYSIAANPPGFPENLPDFETCPGIPDLKFFSRILKFVQKKKKNGDHFFDFVRDCGN